MCILSCLQFDSGESCVVQEVEQGLSVMQSPGFPVHCAQLLAVEGCLVQPELHHLFLLHTIDQMFEASLTGHAQRTRWVSSSVIVKCCVQLVSSRNASLPM